MELMDAPGERSLHVLEVLLEHEDLGGIALFVGWRCDELADVMCQLTEHLALRSPRTRGDREADDHSGDRCMNARMMERVPEPEADGRIGEAADDVAPAHQHERGGHTQGNQ